MDDVRFDRFARALGARLPRRRALGLISSLAAGLGLGRGLAPRPDDAGAKGGGENKKKNRRQGQFRCNGRWMDKCVGGQILDDDACECNCPEGQNFETRCNLCLHQYEGRCCPNERRCDRLCIPKRACCPSSERTCTRQIKQNGKTKTVTSCVPLGACCPGEIVCPVVSDGCCNALAGEECATFDGCCNTLAGDEICDGKWCCTPDETCCPGQGCRPRTEGCCAVACASSPTGCCGQGEQCTELDGCCDTSTHFVCDGFLCCPLGRICTTGTYDGERRGRCCNPNVDPGETLIPCDGVCCVTEDSIICCPGLSNPCRDPVAGC